MSVWALDVASTAPESLLYKKQGKTVTPAIRTPVSAIISLADTTSLSKLKPPRLAGVNQVTFTYYPQ